VRGASRAIRGARIPTLGLIAATVIVIAGVVWERTPNEPLPAASEQACALPKPWLERIKRGHDAGRSGDIAILPDYPAYMTTGGGGWTHSGPWGYLQRVPLVFYGPGFIEPREPVLRPVTLADVAPTLMTMLHAVLPSADGSALPEAARLDAARLRQDRPRLIVVIVWDGGGWNVLERWPRAWPNLKRWIETGVSFMNAKVGSSPSVTPSVHTTIGTGLYPARHGITGITVRRATGEVSDSFMKGESAGLMKASTVAERWDEHNRNRALVGMVAYEPWHLGMIGRGAEDLSGDADDAAWLNTRTNEWITDDDSYNLPASLTKPRALDHELQRLDARDGEVDSAWGSHEILEDPARVEETPAFIRYHTDRMIDMIAEEGYGDDGITDLLFTNYKQIDRVGHYFNMESDEVRQSLSASDRELARLERALNRLVGRGRWTVVLTADHGQQPDAEDVDGFAIDPRELRADIDREFGPVTRAVWPTEIFLEYDALIERSVSIEEIARFVRGYELAANTQRPDMLVRGAGSFGPEDRLFELAIPSARLGGLTCAEFDRDAG
jgi:arylsulfatase A-like enzyme